jgi:S-adenosylmethionine:diacylglycerol 3-amino-3-carboxypropyl transferase
MTAGGGATPWEAGRFDAKHGARKILFGRMYEDSAIEEAAFGASERIFCIASAGCMAMKLAARHEVTAVDINPVQVAYAERRAAGAPMEIGSAERVVNIGRKLMATFGWHRHRLEAFLALEQPAEQLAFWNRHLNTAGFRLATDTLLSVAGLRWIYASAFLEILPLHFGCVMRARLERCWKTHSNRTNPYARGLLLGELSDAPPPAGSDRIRFVCADAASFLESCPPASFDGFTLSNILDGAPEGYRRQLFAAIRHAARPNALVVVRSFAEPQNDSATNVAARDRSILWGVVDVRPARYW